MSRRLFGNEFVTFQTICHPYRMGVGEIVSVLSMCILVSFEGALWLFGEISRTPITLIGRGAPSFWVPR